MARQAAARARRGDEPGGSSAWRRRRQDVRRPAPVSPWGQPTKGYKTRNRKATDRFIVQRRQKCFSFQFPAEVAIELAGTVNWQLVTGN